MIHKNTLQVTQPEESKLSLDNTSSEDIPQLEQKFNVPTRIKTRENNQTTKNDTFCNNIIHHMHCNTNKNYFTDAMVILQKVINFNSTFSSVVIPKMLIKYFLYASPDSPGHIAAMKLYHFLKRLYYFQGMWKTIHQYIRTCQKCQIMN